MAKKKKAPDRLGSIKNITTVEIAERVINEHNACDGKVCRNCYLEGAVRCTDATEAAYKFLLEAARKPAGPMLIKPAPGEHLEGAEDITSLEIACKVITASVFCRTIPCSECYNDGFCADKVKAAKRFIKDYMDKTPTPAAQPEPSKEPKPVPVPAVSKRGACKECAHLRNIGGALFCHGWHNWTVDDGYCYLFSAKMEDVKTVEKPVDNSV